MNAQATRPLVGFCVLILASSWSVSTTTRASDSPNSKAQQAIAAVKELCLVGTQYDLKLDANGNLALLRLAPGAQGSVAVDVRHSAGAAAIFDDKVRRFADEDIRQCIEPHIARIISAILGDGHENSGDGSPAPNSELNGSWKGQTYIGRNGEHNYPINFFVNMTFKGPTITGQSYEMGVMGLRGGISGSLDKDQIRFVKSYEQGPTEVHKASYEGTLDRATQQIQGTWKNDTGSEGTFVLHLSPVPFRMN